MTPESNDDQNQGAPLFGNPIDGLTNTLYDDLKVMARNHFVAGIGLSVSPTTIVHEAILRLWHHAKRGHFNDRLHFVRTAASAMRHVIVDHARRRKAEKRGGGSRAVAMEDAILTTIEKDVGDVVRLDEALHSFAVQDPRGHEVVQLRLFAGLQVAEIATNLRISERSVTRSLARARAFFIEKGIRPQ